MFVVSKSVYLWQAIPAKSNAFEWGRNLPEWSTFQASQGQTLYEH